MKKAAVASRGTIVKEDLAYVYDSLTDKEKKAFKGSTIVITGGGGFLGFYFVHFFSEYRQKLGILSLEIIDNFIVGQPHWLVKLTKDSKGFINLHRGDLNKINLNKLSGLEKSLWVIHMASIASPVFYRKYPLETVDANVWGLRKLLDFFKDKNLKGFLFFSSSEIYGDPLPQFIPTQEDYNGNVSPLGPRACYDEAKRFGETLCYLYALKHRLPIVSVRPFNNYGPGMNLNDKRVPADFAKAVIKGQDIVLFSDGSPTRTFCYVADAVTGYLKALTYGKFDYFNIGIEEPEISIRELAQIYVKKGRQLLGYKGQAVFKKSKEKDYLANNPSRRCPDIHKARRLLRYNPKIGVEKGVARFLKFLTENSKRL